MVDFNMILYFLGFVYVLKIVKLKGKIMINVVILYEVLMIDEVVIIVKKVVDKLLLELIDIEIVGN